MIKVGIIGIGNIGSAHAKALAEGKIEGMTLAALCDCSPERKQWAKERFPAVPFFDNSDDFFASSGAEAVIIATPHYLHPVLALQGFRCGMHVMSEKPAGVSVSSLHPLYEEARRSGKRFGIMWNQRTNPLYTDVRRMVQDGTLGTPQRLIWQATDWYRTQEYYDSGSWRATWAGEGGGVLMNQAPHQLDLMQWIFGLPDHVRAECSVGKYHNIEVEDDAVLFCRYNDGRQALFLTTTGENPGTNRLEICGTEGKLVAEPKHLTVWKKAPDGTFTVTEKKYDTSGPQHVGILNDFSRAIREGTPLLAEGYEGIRELSVVNAAYLSAWTGREVPVPCSEEEFDRMLDEKRRSSRVKTGNGQHTDGTYNKRWGG